MKHPPRPTGGSVNAGLAVAPFLGAVLAFAIGAVLEDHVIRCSETLSREACAEISSVRDGPGSREDRGAAPATTSDSLGIRASLESMSDSVAWTIVVYFFVLGAVATSALSLSVLARGFATRRRRERLALGAAGTGLVIVALVAAALVFNQWLPGQDFAIAAFLHPTVYSHPNVLPTLYGIEGFGVATLVLAAGAAGILTLPGRGAIARQTAYYRTSFKLLYWLIFAASTTLVLGVLQTYTLYSWAGDLAGVAAEKGTVLGASAELAADLRAAGSGAVGAFYSGVLLGVFIPAILTLIWRGERLAAAKAGWDAKEEAEFLTVNSLRPRIPAYMATGAGMLAPAFFGSVGPQILSALFGPT